MCKEHGVDEDKEAWPKAKRRAKEMEKVAAVAAGKKGGQSTLDSVAVKVQAPTVFSPESILKHVMVHIVSSDHVCCNIQASFRHLGFPPTCAPEL